MLRNPKIRVRLSARVAASCVAVCLLACASMSLHAYSVLTHEQIVDFLWESNMKPILLDRFPLSTPEQLRQAHAFGAVQRLGADELRPGGERQDEEDSEQSHDV